MGDERSRDEGGKQEERYAGDLANDLASVALTHGSATSLGTDLGNLSVVEHGNDGMRVEPRAERQVVLKTSLRQGPRMGRLGEQLSDVVPVPPMDQQRRTCGVVQLDLRLPAHDAVHVAARTRSILQ